MSRQWEIGGSAQQYPTVLELVSLPQGGEERLFDAKFLLNFFQRDAFCFRHDPDDPE